jgi:hypothetical protein
MFLLMEPSSGDTNIQQDAFLKDPETVLHNATIVSVLSRCGCTAGSGVGVVIAIVSAQRNRIQRTTQPTAIAIVKTGNRLIQQVAEAAIMQNRK